MKAVDLIIRSRGPWITFDTGAPIPRIGEALRDIAPLEGSACAVHDGRIVAVGSPDEIKSAYSARETLDLGDRLVMPGFCDPHTHPVFNATREDEFEMRNLGHSYVEIAKAGGGIRSSVRSVREASEDDLVDSLRVRADRFLRLGTTTVEAKSGYGLSLESELASLRAIRRVDDDHAVDFVPTFLGAHEIPDEYRDRREDYIDLIIDEMIPAVAKEGLARYCDVFCEDHVFTVEESRRILEAGRAAGMRARVHADEIEATGGAELAADVGGATADHLVAVSEEGLRRMKEAGVVPVLLPGTSFYLKMSSHAPGRRMIDAGLPVALATDFNPGSCHTQSMPMIITLACLNYGWHVTEALTAAVVNSAYSCGLGDDRGLIAPGYRADLIALDVPNVRYLAYHFGDNFVTHVVKDGRVVVETSA